MNKKIYITPNIQSLKFAFAHHLMVLSEGEQTEIIVNDPEEEDVDAGNSLARKKNVWDDDEE